MAELMFGLGQTKKKKETEAKVRNTRANLKDVTITETVESNVRHDQHGREKNYKAKQTATKQNLRDINITETVETNVRAEQFGREKNEKNVRATHRPGHSTRKGRSYMQASQVPQSHSTVGKRCLT